MLHGFFYSHYSRDASVWMTNLGFCFNLGLSMISWFSWMHEAIALSSTKAEYMVVYSINSEATWLRKLISQLTNHMLDPTIGYYDNQILDLTVVYYDNQSCIDLSKDLESHERSKYINIQYHFLKIQLRREQQFLSDILTNPLEKEKFEVLRRDLA